MRGIWGVVGALALAAVGCTHVQVGSPTAAQARAEPPAPEVTPLYADPALGFEISRPLGDAWRFTSGDADPEGGMVAVPVIVAHRATGAQVVVQVAPAVATPDEFAARLTSGLRSRPGFTTTEITPDGQLTNAVGFAFTMGDSVAGRVVVLNGQDTSHVYVLLATWPQDAPPSVIAGVDEILRSMKTTTFGG
jgi:hypothetical protein